MAQLNTWSPSQTVGQMIVCDFTQIKLSNIAGSVDGISGAQLLNGAPVSAAFQINSTLGCLLNSRQTQAEIDNLIPYNGMQLYNTDVTAMQFYYGGAINDWVNMGDVFGPQTATFVGDIVVWNNTIGTVVADSLVKIMLANIGGGESVFLGNNSGNVNVSGFSNFSFGAGNMSSITSGAHNFIFAVGGLENATNCSDNIVIGDLAMNTITQNASRNIVAGTLALSALSDSTECNDNLALGHNVASLATNCEQSVLLGSGVGQNLSAIGDSVLIGYECASISNGTLTNLVGIGSLCLKNVTTNASRLVGVGWSALLSATTAVRCTAVGDLSLSQITVGATGVDSTAVGNDSLAIATKSVGATAVGSESGSTQTQYTTCAFFGYRADANVNDLTNATAIGANATVSTSNSLVLGNNANVGIGTSSPLANLHIVSGGTTPALQIAGSGIIVPFRSTGSQVSNANKTDIIYESLSTTPTIALPVATSDMAGQLLFIKNNSFENTGNYLQLVPSGGQHIDGDASVQINGNHAGAIVYTDGNNWFLIACYGNPGNL